MTENKYSKILVLGAGPVVIGSSSEYDYSAVSVCRALKEIKMLRIQFILSH